MALLGGVSRLMPSREDVGQFWGGHLPPRQHMGDGGDQIVEREHGPGFAMGHLLLDQEQRREHDQGHVVMPGIPAPHLIVRHTALALRLTEAMLDEETLCLDPRQGPEFGRLRCVRQAIVRHGLCPDLAAQARYAAWRRVQVPIAIATVVVWLPFGLDALCWIGGVRILWGLHAMAALNSLCHAGSRPGARDRSRNLAWLGLVQLGVGENWHGNHHDDPASARIGWTWWQVDLGYWLLIALQRVRLASNVRPPRAARRAPAAGAPSLLG